MHTVSINSNLFVPDNFKYVEVNSTEQTAHQIKILRGIKKAQTIIDKLEHSLQKSNEYEDRLLRCRTSHDHLHDSDDWTNDDDFVTRDVENSSADDRKTSKSFVDLTESWSIMSLVCIQHQYEELSKLYNNLLKAYNECCSYLNSYNTEFFRLQNRLNKARKEVSKLNKTILTIGNKYLTLKYNKITQKAWYEKRIDKLKSAIQAMLITAERARFELDEQGTHDDQEQDIAIALFLAEIKKCNNLFKENLKLKSQIQEMETKHNENK